MWGKGPSQSVISLLRVSLVCLPLSLFVHAYLCVRLIVSCVRLRSLVQASAAGGGGIPPATLDNVYTTYEKFLAVFPTSVRHLHSLFVISRGRNPHEKSRRREVQLIWLPPPPWLCVRLYPM